MVLGMIDIAFNVKFNLKVTTRVNTQPLGKYIISVTTWTASRSPRFRGPHPLTEILRLLHVTDCVAVSIHCT